MPKLNPPSAPSGDRRTITCLYCHQPQEVAQLALSITCGSCHKPLNLENVVITQHKARREIATCGVLTVEKRGTIIAEVVLCGLLVVRGKLKGKIESQGPVVIGRDAEVKGDITAPTLVVGIGAVLDGQYDIGPKTAPPRSE